VEVRYKTYCLTLESFIEKIVEHLPKEIKDKREVAIKDRIIMKSNTKHYLPNLIGFSNNQINNIYISVEESRRAAQRFSRNGPYGLGYPQQQADATIPPPQYQPLMNRNVDFNTDVLFDQSEISRMNLHDTASIGGPPMRHNYVNRPRHSSNRHITRSNNTSTRR